MEKNTIQVTPTDDGGITVVYDEAGGISVIDAVGDRSYIAQEHRAAVALAILGGVTDELVADLMAAVYNEVPWPDGGSFDPKRAKENIRNVLGDLFGIDP